MNCQNGKHPASYVCFIFLLYDVTSRDVRKRSVKTVIRSLAHKAENLQKSDDYCHRSMNVPQPLR